MENLRPEFRPSGSNENLQRLTPLPVINDLQPDHINYSPGYSSFDDTLDNKRSLRQYFNIIYKRRLIILAITILATAAASFYSYGQPSIYHAQARMIIEPRKPQVTLKDAINVSLGDDQKYNKTQAQLLQDPDLMKRVVVALGLHRDENLFGGQIAASSPGIRWQKTPIPENSPPVVSEVFLAPDKIGQIQLTPEENTRAKRYVKILNDGFKVEQIEGTNILTVNVHDSNPELAVKVAFKIAELFIEENAELETTGAQKAFKNLGSSIEELKLTIIQQETDLIGFMQSSGLPLQEKGQDLAASRLEGMSESWLKAMESRRQLEARFNSAVAASNSGQGMNIPDLYENKIFQDTTRLNAERRTKLQDQIRDIQRQIQEAETQKEELLVTYTSEHIKVKEKTERIVSLNAAKEKTEKEVLKIIDLDQKKFEKDAVSGTLVALKSQLDAARIQEAESQSAYDLEASRSNVQGQTQTKLTTLKRGIETNRGLLDTYTQRQKEQELALSSERPNNIKIQNRAVTPDEPVGPHRIRNIFVALLLSFAAGIGLVFLLDYLDDSVRTSDDINHYLDLPTLALIPHYINTDNRKLSLLTKNGNGNAALATMEERNSPMAEAYRHLRTSLLFSSAGKPPQTILITSTEPSEGKTTTAINTAITLAQSDVDVVIIDCDLRRPRLHNHFGLDNTFGLTNYLSGDNYTEDLICIYKELPRLRIITSGPIPPNPTELLSSNEMGDLIQFLSAKFKHVIIDSPPAISFTDATILSTLVDGVVLVAMSNESSIHQMLQFKHRLGNIGARIYGVVLNGVKAGSMEYDYYGSGYYKYYSQD